MLLTYLSADLIKEADEKKKKILVVGENIDFLRGVMAKLSDIYEVAVAKSTEQARGYLKTHEVDLLLVDYQMPKLTDVDEGKIIGVHFEEMNVEEVASLADDYFSKVDDSGKKKA